MEKCKKCGSDNCHGWEAELAELLDENKPTKIRDFVRRVIEDIEIAHYKEMKDAYWHGKNDLAEKLQKECLDYCLSQNGRPDCKNCGLSRELLQ